MSYTNYHRDYARNKILLAPGTRVDSLFAPTATQQHALGRILEADDATGRKWRYCKNGATALVQAHMNAAEAPNAAGLEVVQTGYTMSVGDTIFDMLLTTAHGYSNHELIDGWLWVNKVATILGDQYLIKDNWIVTADTVMKVEIADQGGIRHAIAATHELSVHKSPFRDVIVAPTTLTAVPVGVNNVAVPIGYYFWAQYRGPCTIIRDTTGGLVIGEMAGHPATCDVAGTVGVINFDGTNSQPIYGTVMTIAADAEAALINLNLP